MHISTFKHKLPIGIDLKPLRTASILVRYYELICNDLFKLHLIHTYFDISAYRIVYHFNLHFALKIPLQKGYFLFASYKLR